MTGLVCADGYVDGAELFGHMLEWLLHAGSPQMADLLPAIRQLSRCPACECTTSCMHGPTMVWNPMLNIPRDGSSAGASFCDALRSRALDNELPCPGMHLSLLKSCCGDYQVCLHPLAEVDWLDVWCLGHSLPALNHTPAGWQLSMPDAFSLSFNTWMAI